MPISSDLPRGRVTLIAAVARNGAIGRNNQLLVHLPGDLPRFRQVTLGHSVIMGRKTWDSIGRALPGRRNIVVTRNAAWRADAAEAAPDIDAALQRVAAGEEAFVIGGAGVYALALPLASRLLLTEIDADFADANVFFPAWPREAFTAVSSEAHTTPDGLRFRYIDYQRH